MFCFCALYSPLVHLFRLLVVLFLDFTSFKIFGNGIFADPSVYSLFVGVPAAHHIYPCSFCIQIYWILCTDKNFKVGKRSLRLVALSISSKYHSWHEYVVNKGKRRDWLFLSSRKAQGNDQYQNVLNFYKLYKLHSFFCLASRITLSETRPQISHQVFFFFIADVSLEKIPNWKNWLLLLLLFYYFPKISKLGKLCMEAALFWVFKIDGLKSWQK